MSRGISYQFKRRGIDVNISISAVSRNRRFTKALVRYASRVDELRNACEGVNLDEMPFDTLQIVFLDRDQSYVRPVGCKADRLFQVEVATPDEPATDYSSAEVLLHAISEKVLIALEKTNLEEQHKRQIVSAIEAVGKSK